MGKNKDLYHIQVKGRMDSHHIRRACNAKGMKPLCDHAKHQDGHCVVIGGFWHWSLPIHNKQHGVDVKRTKFVYFYTNHHHRARLNTGTSHRWSNGRDRNGITMCVKQSTRHSKKKKSDMWYLKGGQNGYCRTGRNSEMKCDTHKHGRGRMHPAKFTIEHVGGNIYALQPHTTGRYCADEGNRLKCNRPWKKGWEKFQVILIPGHTGQFPSSNQRFALKGSGRGRRGHKFCADERARVKCNRRWVGGWEKFTLIAAGKSGTCRGQVELYQHGGFNGRVGRFSKGRYKKKSEMERKGTRNDDASSIIVPDGCIAYLYGHENFRGWKAIFPPGRYNYHQFIGRGAKNDQASSLEVKDH